MSLGRDQPITRPLPPARSRRHSRIATTFDWTASAQTVSSPNEPVCLEKNVVTGVLGGLREKSEEEIGRASRDELQRALREAWALQDELERKAEEGKTLKDQVEEERTKLQAALQAANSRYDDALMEQRYLEVDVEERDQLLERLRGRLAESERQCREIAKRALEQEKAFEGERTALQNQEVHLQQRLRALQDTRPHQNVVPSQALDELQEELATLSVSHSTLLATINTLTTEMQELKVANRTLAEENEGWEFLVRERTLKGRMRTVSGVSTLFEVDEEHGEVEGEEVEEGKSMLERLDEEMEQDLEEAEEHSDSGGMLSTSPDTVSARIRPGSRGQGRSKVRGESLGDLPVTGSGMDLAAELGRAEVDLEGSEMHVLGKGDEGDALRAEVKKLREENKALQLYCSKILDRIIAQDGFEHILSVDYKTRRAGSRNVSGSSRKSVKDVDFVEPDAGPNVREQSPVSREDTRPRPLSMVSRAIMGSDETATTAPEVKAKIRAKRGFSLDFRSLGFGLSSGSSSPADPRPDPALRPLHLASRATASIGGTSTSNTTQNVGFIPLDSSTESSATSSISRARRLEREEEDDNDKRERHRLEAALKLIGMDDPSPPPGSSKTPARPTRKLTKSNRPPTREEKRPLVGPPLPQDMRRGTPLSRLSSALSSLEDDAPRSPLMSPSISDSDANVSPEQAAEAVFRDFDMREQETVKALSGGRGGGYTSPGGSVLGLGRAERRRTASGRWVSGGSSSSVS